MDDRLEQEVPGQPGVLAGQMFNVLSGFIPPAFLSFGGGTVLAARWSHRVSLDVDLFCDPSAYGALGAAGLEALEAAIKAIPGCAEEPTWCDSIGTYAEIDGFEVTVLPRASPLLASASPPARLAGTGLSLQSSARILHAKIVNRIYEAGEIVVRDLYDIACAAECDLPALQEAVGGLAQGELYVANELIKHLPAGWSQDNFKPLLDPRFQWDEPELMERALSALATPARTPDDGDLPDFTP